MYVILKNNYCDAEEYNKSVVVEAIPKSIFMKNVRDAVEKLYSRTNIIRNNHRMFANILEHYLDKYKIDEIIPDEKFFKEMWDRLIENGQLSGREYSINSRKKVSRTTRKIVNEYFYPKGLLQRKVLKNNVRQHYEKFFSLTKRSQEAIKWFEKNGKVVRAIPVYVKEESGSQNIDMIKIIHQLSNRVLLPVTIGMKIQQAMLFLRVIGKNGFEQATDKDVKKLEEYCEQRKLKKKDDYLADVATFFINIQSKGFIKHNPFANVSLKKNGEAVKKDFISKEDIEKIKDLSTINYEDKVEVRDRLVMLLAYDLALRISEFLALKVSDIRKESDGDWHVLIRSEIQKGHKDEDVMYLFLDETKKLLDYYLKKVRKQFNPNSDCLIVSNHGGPLCSQHCRVRFKELCDKLGIKTFYGKRPSPHCLRHTFATLNIEPLGLSLPLYEITQRLRHARVETAKHHYIHNNPYLKKEKHKAYQTRGKKKTTTDFFNEIPLAELEHWLSDTLKVDSLTIATIRKNHKKMLSEAGEASVDKPLEDNTIYLPEKDVIAKLEHLNISIYSLRQYAFKERLLAKGFKGGLRLGSGFRYKKEFIDDFVRNWVPVQNIQKKLKMEQRSFQRIARKEKWRTLQIGRKRFIHREDCI